MYLLNGMLNEEDSYRTCVAAICAAATEEVPHFVGPDITIDDQIGMMRDYLKKEHGAYLIVIRILAAEDPKNIDHAYSNALLMGENLPCIVWGTDESGKPHCVIAKNGWAAHDPHPNEIGLHGPLPDAENGHFLLQWIVKPVWERPVSTRRRGPAPVAKTD